MHKHRILSAFLALVLLCSLVAMPVCATEPDLALQCTSAVLMDGNYGDVLYDQSAYEKGYPSHMTHVMTALLTLEALEAGTISEDTIVTVSENAARKEVDSETTVNLQAGEEITIKDLLYCIMLPSANDATRALAEHVGGSVEAFVDTMNTRAAELGCVNTHFVNPNGLHDPEHYSCAYDIALIFKAALEYDLFRQIIGTADYTVPATNLSGERNFYNTNGLISNLYYSGYVYEKCIGGKTGSSTEAGKCLVAAARDGDMLMISVLMCASPIETGDGTTRQGQFDESKRLLVYGLLNFRRYTLTQPSKAVAEVKVTMSEDGEAVGVRPRGSLALTLQNTFTQEDVQTKVELFKNSVEAPVAEGQVMGALHLYDGDRELGQLELVAERSLEYSKKLYRKQQFQKFMETTGKKIIMWVVIILLTPVVGLVALRFINIIRRKIRKKRRQKRAAQRRATQQAKNRQQ